jgi:hypothetical protein
MIQVTLKTPLPMSLPVSEAADYVGHPRLFDDMREAGWIKPLVEKKKMVLFDRSDLEGAYARFYAGEYPNV